MILAHQKLIWLMAIIAMVLAFSKIKSGHFLYRSKALKLMTYGCLLLIAGTTIGLVGHMGLLGPEYSKSIVFFIVESIAGYFCGWALIIWGMALWLPYFFSVSNRLQKKTKSVNLYEAITRISSYGDASPSTFNRIALSILENYGYQGASIHILNKANDLSLFASVGLTNKSKEIIKTVKDSLYNKVFDTGDMFQADESIRIHKDIIIETDDGPVIDALSIPVNFGIKQVGVLTVYTNHLRTFSQEELRVLEAVCANLGLAFYRDGLQKSVKYNSAFRDFIAVVLKTSRSGDNLNSQVIRLAKLLKQYIKFNSIKLYLTGDGAPHILDFNLPDGKKIIIEKGYFSGEDYKPVKWVLQKNRSLSLPDDNDILKTNFKTPGNCIALYTPVIIGGQSIGVLNMNVKGDYKFSQNDMIVMDAIASVISSSLLEELNNTLTSKAFDQIGAIKYSLESVIEQKIPANVVYRELAKIIVENSPATFCRIMYLDNERKRFQTVAIYQRRQMLWDENTITGLSVEDMYAHRKVIATGKPEIISDSDPTMKISELEKRLMMPVGISQCMIIPIIRDGKSVGVVTVGENRQSDRGKLGPFQLVYAMLLSNVISIMLWQKENVATRNILVDSNRAANRRLQYFQKKADTIKMVSGFNSRVNGPLAGILASCEYLIKNQEVKKDELRRYLHVINKNADKIHKLTDQFAEVKKVIDII